MVDDLDIHALVAPYALGALVGGECDRFERHLEVCGGCRAGLPSFQSAAAALALDVEAAAPPAPLRARIVSAARQERNPSAAGIPPPRRRFALPPVASLAAVAACAAVGFGVWAAILSGDRRHEQAVGRTDARALAILSDPTAQRYPLHGARGAVVVTRGRDAALVVSRLGRAPHGRTYELWVVAGQTPQPAGVFAGGGNPAIVALTRRVPSGARVSVSLERAGGSPRLTGRMLFGTGTT